MRVFLASSLVVSFDADDHATQWPFDLALMGKDEEGDLLWLGHPCDKKEHPFHLKSKYALRVMSGPEGELELDLPSSVAGLLKEFTTLRVLNFSMSTQLGSAAREIHAIEQSVGAWWNESSREADLLPITSGV